MKYTLFPKDAFSLLESNKKLKLQKLFSVKELRATRFGASFFPSSFFLCLGSRSDTFLDCATCHASKRQVKDWKFFVCFLLLIVTLCLLVLFLCRALMDCLVLPIQNKLEEWRKITHALEREHAKGSKI